MKIRNLTDSIRLGVVRLSRAGYSGGFGVQSPWAFNFVNHVIGDRSYAPAYDMLKKRYPDTDLITRKMCRLCMRICVHEKPATMAFLGNLPQEYEAYSLMGWKKSRVLYLPTGPAKPGFETLEPVGFAVIEPGEGVEQRFDAACRRAHNGTIILVPGIYTDKKSRELWNGRIAELEHVLRFDLYFCGLAYCDDKRYSEEFYINF